MDKIASALRLAARTVDRAPTDAQKAAGNYRHGHVRLHGLDIAIENPKGGERSGVDKGGKRWSVKMPAHYGYVKRTEGKDGDAVDVYVGPEPDSNKVFIVDQVDAGSGKFDEHKCCLGYTSKEQALADYEKAFSDGKAKDRIGSVTAMSVEDFKGWLKDGDTTKPMSRKAYASGGSVVASALRIARKRADGGAVSDLYGETYKPDLGSDSEGDITTADMLARMKARDAGFPGALRDVARAIPHVEADDTSTASGIISRLGRTATEIPRSSLNTVANWLGRTPEIGPDTIAPLGLAPMGSLVGHSASLAKPSVADHARARYLEWKHPHEVSAPDTQWLATRDGTRNAAEPIASDPDAAVINNYARGVYRTHNDVLRHLEEARNLPPSPERDALLEQWRGMRGRTANLMNELDAPEFTPANQPGQRSDRLRLLAENNTASTPGLLLNSLPMDEASRLNRAREMGFDTENAAYRGLSRPYDEGEASKLYYQMFTSSPAEAGEYAMGNPLAKPNVVPAYLRKGRNLEVDANSQNFNSVPTKALPDDIRAQLRGDVARTDEIAHAARSLGYDSVTIKNVIDNATNEVIQAPKENPALKAKRAAEMDAMLAELGDLGLDTPPAAVSRGYEGVASHERGPVTVNAVFDPKNIRSKYAAFNPLDSDKAGLLLSDQSKASLPGTIVNSVDAAGPRDTAAAAALPERPLDSSTRQQAKAPGAEPSIKSSGGSVGHHMHNPKIARALRTARQYAEGGNVPLSDAGPVPGQEWPDTYDPQGGADFLGMLKDTGTGIASAIAPPIPGYNHPTLSEGAEALRAKVADKSQGEVLRESLGEFAERVPDAVLQGSPTKAFPIAGRAISSALRTAGRTAGANPATAATAAGGLGLTGLAASTGEAGGEDPIKRLMASDPALQALDAQIKETERIARSSPKQQTLRNREMANQALPGLQKQFSERVAELTKGNLPWDKAHPEVAKWWPWIQVGAPMAAAMTMKGGLNYADRMATRPWRNAVRRAEDAFAKGDEKTAAFQSGKATEFLADEPSGAGGMARRAWNVTKDAALPTVAGAGLGAELSLLPHQHNRSNAPVGSEERLEAERRLAPESFFQTAAPGTIAGFLGGVTGAHLPNIRPGYRPAAETRNLQRRVLGEPGTQTPLPSGSLQSQALGSEGAQSLPRTQALQAETANPQIQGGSTSPRALEPPRGKAESLSADTPAESFSSSPQSSSALPPIRRKDKNGRAYWHDRMTGHRASKPDKSSSNKTPADEDPPFAHGGIVRSALRIARKFGGRIGKSGGLLKSDVPGRTDHIETSVKSGSFVVPADTLSHLGQNNTMAGAKKLDALLKSGPCGTSMGKSPTAGPKAQKALSMTKSKFASGGAVDVPILAAGGEYIIGPEQVVEIGGGDLDRGHAILDKFVLDVRNDHIATLQNLPGPQKD